MEDLSHYMLDIAENSITAGATCINIELSCSAANNSIELRVCDNGCGMSEQTVKSVSNPFFTSRTTRRVGMGIPFLKQIAELCGGHIAIDSVPGEGTRLSATFQADSIDCPPIGDVASTLLSLIMRAPRVDWNYVQKTDRGKYVFSVNELDEVLESREEILIPEIALWLRNEIAAGVKGTT